MDRVHVKLGLPIDSLQQVLDVVQSPQQAFDVFEKYLNSGGSVAEVEASQFMNSGHALACQTEQTRNASCFCKYCHGKSRSMARWILVLVKRTVESSGLCLEVETWR